MRILLDTIVSQNIIYKFILDRFSEKKSPGVFAEGFFKGDASAKPA